MGVYRRNDSGVYWYDFTVDGTRHRGSSGTKKLTEARAVEAALIVKAKEQGSMPFVRYAPRSFETLQGAFWSGSSLRDWKRTPSVIISAAGN